MTERIEAVALDDVPDTPSVGATIRRTRQAYLAIALFFAAIVAWGFWKTYFAPLLGGTAEHAWLIHVHAAVFVGWVLLLIAQAAVVAAGRVRLHRQIGAAGMLYGALVFAVGLYVSVGSPALRVRTGFYPLEVGGVIVLYNLTDMLLFGVFLAAAFVSRGRPEVHKRWIISATAALGGRGARARHSGRLARVSAHVARAGSRRHGDRSRDAPPHPSRAARQQRADRGRLLQGAAVCGACVARRRPSAAASICLSSPA